MSSTLIERMSFSYNRLGEKEAVYLIDGDVQGPRESQPHSHFFPLEIGDVPRDDLQVPLVLLIESPRPRFYL